MKRQDFDKNNGRGDWTAVELFGEGCKGNFGLEADLWMSDALPLIMEKG